jgi:hypothetical protein
MGNCLSQNTAVSTNKVSQLDLIAIGIWDRIRAGEENAIVEIREYYKRQQRENRDESLRGRLRERNATTILTSQPPQSNINMSNIGVNISDHSPVLSQQQNARVAEEQGQGISR